ncbi:CheR family methyltransferase [Sphingomonas sp. SRS2]|uniref:CheR family methyltransferase n=1 Tax=Sphingomonas sp. SRS2 TaxID=133190 RepID=UPI00061848B4|nr:protein-glutamate O-methyltransferase CheR [Sphingomonas sp. SRS2]KKC26445.1 chemotaxis protein CheR [Sphingomonas sp. SRS2]
MEVSPRAALIIASLFEKATGQLLSQDRFWRIGTTLSPFCRARGIDSFDRLALTLERSSDPELSLDMIDALLNNETSFFRDAVVFSHIADQILPQIAANRQREKRIRVWSAACSTGQEAYSLAMLFAEQGDRWNGWKIEILGSDISRSAVQQARGGLYTQFEVQRGLPIRQLIAWFDPVLDQGWRAKPALTSVVTFTRHNLLGPPPAGGRFDLILCRNALLYFSPERRHQLLEGLSLALASDGALLLGAGETALGNSTRFISDPVAQTVYRAAAYTGLSNAA